MALDPESPRLIDLMAAANRPEWNPSRRRHRGLYLSLSGRPRSAPSEPRWSTANSRCRRRFACASIARPRCRRASCVPGLFPGGAGCSASQQNACSCPSPWKRASGSSRRLRLRRKCASPARFDDVGGGLKCWRPTAPDRRRFVELSHRRRERWLQPRCGGRDLGARQWRTQAPPAASRLSGD